MRMPLHPAKSQITLPNVLFALSDPTRLQIVKAIAKHDNMNCCDIQIDLLRSICMSQQFMLSCLAIALTIWSRVGSLKAKRTLGKVIWLLAGCNGMRMKQ